MGTVSLGGDSNGFGDVFVKGVSSLTRTYTTSVEVDVGGGLVIADIDGGDTNDNLFVGIAGGLLEISDTVNTVGTSIVGAVMVNPMTVRVPLNRFTGDLMVNSLAGDDTVTIGDLNGLPGGLQISTGIGDDQIVQTGDVTLTGRANAFYDAEQARFQAGSSVTTNNGAINVAAVGAAAGSNHSGIWASGSGFHSTGGSITLTGQGGTTGSYNYGIYLNDTDVSSGTFQVSLFGIGGGTDYYNDGVYITGGSEVTAGGAGAVDITDSLATALATIPASTSWEAPWSIRSPTT